MPGLVTSSRPKPTSARLDARPGSIRPRLHAAWPMLPGVGEVVTGRVPTPLGTSGLPSHALGAFGPCLDFTAASKHYLDTGLILPAPKRFAIVARVRKRSAGLQTICAQVNADVTRASFYLRIGGGSGFTSFNTGGNYNQVTVPDLTLNTWHDVALVYDRQNLVAITDGLVVAFTPVSGSAPVIDAHPGTAKIGRLGDSDGQYWDGQIDSIHVYHDESLRGASEILPMGRDPYAAWRPRWSPAAHPAPSAVYHAGAAVSAADGPAYFAL